MKNLNVTFNEIYNTYHKGISNFVGLKINNPFDKEEIVQDIFLKISQKLNSFDSDKGNLRNWVYTITNNTIIDFFRTNKSYQTVSVSDYLNDNGTENFQIESTDYHKGNIENAQLQANITKCFDKLNGNYQTIAKLSLLEGKKYREIAEMLNIPMGNVKATLSRAKNQLRAMLKQEYALI